MRRYVFSVAVLAAAIIGPAAQARSERPSDAGSANLTVRAMATTAPAVHLTDFGFATIPNGGSRAVYALTFTVGVNIANYGPDPAAGIVYGLTLPAGLHWEPGQTDPECTFSTSGIDCRTSQSIPNADTALAFWHVTADAPGTYAVEVHASSPTPDPDTADNSASASVVVQEHVLAGAAKVAPKRPKAGSVVRVRVDGIVAGGDPVAPIAPVSVAATAPRCGGSVGGKTLNGSPRTTLGRVTCVYRTRRSDRGKRLGGTVSFHVAARTIQRRFAVRLR